MEKFDSQKHGKLIGNMPFSYVSTLVYLDFCAYVIRKNEENLVVKEDPVSHDLNCFFLPEKKANWEFITASMVSAEDIQKIVDSDIEISSKNQTETEYIFLTEDFINPTQKYKNKIKQFEKCYKYKMCHLPKQT